MLAEVVVRNRDRVLVTLLEPWVADADVADVVADEEVAPPAPSLSSPQPRNAQANKAPREIARQVLRLEVRVSHRKEASVTALAVWRPLHRVLRRRDGALVT